ncbi:MAG: hypothetical protein JWL84_4728 [Rhodospirillales bacterium]|jgi:hypothetical protein|nr:hypothetical protein [Rhodospirillales bacterium]
MDEADLVLVTAAGFVECMGVAAVDFLEQHAEIAARRGDRFSEEAWREVAAAATRLLHAGLYLT